MYLPICSTGGGKKKGEEEEEVTAIRMQAAVVCLSTPRTNSGNVADHTCMHA